MNDKKIFIEFRDGGTCEANTLRQAVELLGGNRGPVRRDVHVPRKFWVWQHLRGTKKKPMNVMYHRGCFTMPEGHDLSV